jgi:hypothetical protein
MGCSRDIPALLEFINSRQTMPYWWGENDCATFVGGAVNAATGKDPLKGLRWSSQAGAMRVLKREGGMEAALDKRFKRVAPSMAKRGDIAGVPDPVLGIHPMIVEGEKLVAPGDGGNKRIPRRAMVVAWSVCC